MSATAPHGGLHHPPGFIIVATDHGTTTGTAFQVEEEGNGGGDSGATGAQAPAQLPIPPPALVPVTDCDFRINLHGTVNPTEFQVSLADSLSRLYEERSNTSCDVLLHAGPKGERYVRVHRSIICAFSPLVADLCLSLDPYQCKELDVYLPDIRYPDLVILVKFFYSGEVCVPKRTSRLLQKWLTVFGFNLMLSEKGPVDWSEARERTIPINKTDADCSQDEIRATTESDFKCKQCDVEFEDEESLKAHRQSAHTVHKFQCKECGKRFRYKDSYQNHLRVHTGTKIRCGFCDKEFASKRDAKDHENIHTRETVYTCEVCSQSFDTRKQMLNHRASHKGVELPCKICGKKLKNANVMRAHMKNHNSVASHSCLICGKAFKRPFDLKVHSRIHSGDKPYRCNICSKHFSLSTTLAKHKKLHANTIYPSEENDANLPSSSVILDSETCAVVRHEEDGTATITIGQDIGGDGGRITMELPENMIIGNP